MPERILIKQFAMFWVPLKNPTFNIPAADAYLEARSQIPRWFLDIFYTGINVPLTTLILSPKKISGPFMSTPIKINFYQSFFTSSRKLPIATTSDPKVDDSTVTCRFQYHIIGSELRKINTLFWIRQVSLSSVWSASTHLLSYTSFL